MENYQDEQKGVEQIQQLQFNYEILLKDANSNSNSSIDELQKKSSIEKSTRNSIVTIDYQNHVNQLLKQYEILNQFQLNNKVDGKNVNINFQNFWVIEQIIVDPQIAEYSLKIGLATLLLLKSNLKGSLYCLSKIISFRNAKITQQLLDLDWSLLYLDELTEENLEFLIQNSDLKCMQQLLFSKNKIDLILNIKSDYSNKILKKIFTCLDSYCFNYNYAEILYQKKVIDKILKYLSVANQECFQLIGSLCLSQNAQNEILETDIQKKLFQNLKSKNSQIVANSYYALSGICFNQSYLQLKFVNSDLPKFMKSHLSQASEVCIIDSLSQLISNLTYNNDQVKQILGDFIPILIEIVLNFLQYLKDKKQQKEQYFKGIKSLLRALCNLIFIKTNAILACEHNLAGLCSFLYSNELIITEYLDLLINLGIHQLMNQQLLISLDNLIQTQQYQEHLIKIIDSIISSAKQFSKFICSEFNLVTYKNILKQQTENHQIIQKIYKLVSILLSEKQNFIYLQECGLIDEIKPFQHINIQYYYEKIQNQLQEITHMSRIFGNLDEKSEQLFDIKVVKGNNKLNNAILQIKKDQISISQNGITKSKYIIQKLKDILDLEIEQKEFKNILQIKNILRYYCLGLIGYSKSQMNKIIIQAQNQQQKQKIFQLLQQFISDQVKQ
ncbi:unnamed protein product [Paramecium primaurelia]|uniref:Uncharacterized protein n=1 Tax=Paramecium primaurelia TaxID=5886 RepID=A0A8S1K4I7_PARPR|nr:unnamed protein product [Paramecium primaurelia]